ncbi:hypothetical protein F5X99DRAFT_334647 [Biscogniauxia marginata]|nr:hypothetical protein F5X99DRAFT_334647 [Biscogniauxia marginata]
MPPATLQPSASVLSAGSTVSKADLVEQREVEAIWRDVQNKVIELAGGDPKKLLTELNIDSVLKYIDEIQASDKKKAEKYGWFKDTVRKTLRCINTVGGIVAENVSNIFAPAGVCYNALTFVIQAWQGYEGIFENLAELLEKCVEFLERLESYQGRMDTKLSRLACQNLRLFVEICDRTIRLRKKHTRFLAFTKQLFLNDNGIQDLLGMMERLNAKEALLVNAQTYRLVSDSAGDIKLILDTQRDQRKEDDAKKRRRIIAKALGFPGTNLDNDGEPIPTWQRVLDSRLNSLVDETGSWWNKDTVCSTWTTAAYPEKPIIVLSGNGGTGKTSLMANTVRSVRKIGQNGPTSRIVTAYYFSEGDKRKPGDDDESDLLESISRTLLWQISTSYEAMAKSVAHIIERSSGIHGSLDLWQQLFINNKERRNPDTTFYLFIDELDDKLVPLLHKLSTVPENHKARIFLTARPEMITDWLAQPGGIYFSTVPISTRNCDDIDKYITFRMDNMPILRDAGRPGISEWRKTILETLRVKCAGDYFNLNTVLDQLATVDLVEDIRGLLEEAGKTRTYQIDAEIRRLNRDRTPKEIEEINEIILWVETGRRWFSVATMEAILSVKHSRISRAGRPSDTRVATRNQPGLTTVGHTDEANAPTTLTLSLLPFAQKLVQKYPIFGITDSGMVDWRSSEIKNRIPVKGVEPEADSDIEVFSGPHFVQKSEVDIVRHFLRNVCPDDLYRRFDFESFLGSKLVAKDKEYISLDPDNAHIKIALTCLTILTDEEIKKDTNLRRYAMYWLLTHLQQVDLSVADPQLKSDVGPLLVKLFTDECGIDSMFWPSDLNVSMKTWDRDEYTYMRESRREWLYSTDGVREILRWFRDTSVIRGIQGELGDSFVAAIKAPDANLYEVVFSHAAKHMASHLFLRIEFLKRQFLSACCFIREYLWRLGKKPSLVFYGPAEDPDKKSPPFEAFEDTDFSRGEIEEIEAWAVKVLGRPNDRPTQQSLWEIHGALITYQLCAWENGTTEVYQERARHAIKLNPQNWHACHFIAKQPNTSDEEAVDLLTRAKKAVDDLRAKDKTWILDHANSSLLARITLDLGDRLWALGKDYKLAARTHRESLQYDYVHFTNYADVLVSYQNKAQWDEFIGFIEALNNCRDAWCAYFDELVNEFIADLIADDSDMLALAADATGRWDIIESFFDVSINIGSKLEAYDLLFPLQDCFAMTLSFAAGNIHEDKVVAIRTAALNDIRVHPSNTLSREVVDGMGERLAEIYFDKAFRPDASSELMESYGLLIAGLLPEPGDAMDVRTKNITVGCLIRYYHKRKIDSEVARVWRRRIIRVGLELLSDDDEENDDSAYFILGRLLTTLEDVANTRIVWATRNMIQYEAHRKWEEWMTTPTTSPLSTRTNASFDPRPTRRQTPTNSTSTASRRPKGNSPRAHSHDSNHNHALEKSKANGHKPDEPSVSATSAEEYLVSPPSEASEDPLGSTPSKPGWMVTCAGCDKRWTVMDVPLYTCADCVGSVQLDEECHALLTKGQLNVRGLKCKKDHVFIPIPRWEPTLFAGMPKKCLPLPDGDEKRRWISVDEFKGELRRIYLDDGGNQTAS